MISSNLDQTMTFYCGLLVSKKLLVKPTSEGGRVAFLDAYGLMLEVVEPRAPVRTPAREPAKSEAGIRHITFRADDVQATCERLHAQGVLFTTSPRKTINT
jgi:glyoxylase I family protein